MKKVGKKVGILVLVLAVISLATVLIMTITDGRTPSQVATETSMDRLNRFMKDIKPQTVSPIKGTVELGGTSLQDELPDISSYPLTVEGRMPLNIEIFSSTEKSGKGTDGWLNEMAETFNARGIMVNGKRASVSVRAITSGLIGDYIISGKYMPDAFTPSNELWGQMIMAQGGKIKLERSRLVGNMAGILVKKDKKEQLSKDYGVVNVKSVVEATTAEKMVMGYTNPLASSAGMNFLISTLSSFNKADPLSNEAVKGFTGFQEHIPGTAFSTLQMTTAAQNGSLDGFIYEYQLYKNKPDIRRDYEFFPYGVRHDNPIYSVGTLTPDKQELLDAFIDFCMSSESQELATKYGFNGQEEYTSEVPMYSGDILLSAQSIWKDKKNAGRNVVAIFVADVSGSMDGDPLTMLKQSLENGSNYIKATNKVGLVSFDSNVYINLPISEFNLNNRAYFSGAVQNLQAGSKTATYDGVLVAISLLQEELSKNPNEKGIIFLLSDGAQNVGHSFEELSSIAQTLKFPIHTIGYNTDDSTKQTLQDVSNINEAAAVIANLDNVKYVLKGFFNAEM